mmetsp:Transcript_25418/g.64630  ORF Transcript_25418/g.64630 Transcript_25418/m.64630 type:complete len:127 (-) Transcript_25418:143-523(-)
MVAAAAAPAGVVGKDERLASARREKLENMALNLGSDLKEACKAAHALGKRELTWGAILPTIVPGSNEDLDEILTLFAQTLKDNQCFSKVEWLGARAPSKWGEDPCRFGGHVHIRTYWSDAAQELFG